MAIVASLSPIDTDALTTMLKPYPLIVSVEAHFVNGGLGSLLAEVIAEHSLSSCLIRLGVSTLRTGVTGSEAYLNKIHGIDADSIAARVIEANIGLV